MRIAAKKTKSAVLAELLELAARAMLMSAADAEALVSVVELGICLRLGQSSFGQMT
jgi:hypothetical protein